MKGKCFTNLLKIKLEFTIYWCQMVSGIRDLTVLLKEGYGRNSNEIVFSFSSCFFLDLRVCPNPVVGYFNRVNKNRQHPFVSFIELAGKMQ